MIQEKHDNMTAEDDLMMDILIEAAYRRGAHQAISMLIQSEDEAMFSRRFLATLERVLRDYRSHPRKTHQLLMHDAIVEAKRRIGMA